MKNQVIEVLNKEHEKKVIEYWKSRGVDTKGYAGDCTKESFLGSELRFYGIIDGRFDKYTKEDLSYYNAEVIELPEEKVYPRVMMVSSGDSGFWFKRVVFMEKNGKYVAWNRAETIQESEEEFNAVGWDYAKDIEEPKEFTITLSEINSKMDDIKKLFGAEENDKIVIKED